MCVCLCVRACVRACVCVLVVSALPSPLHIKRRREREGVGSLQFLLPACIPLCELASLGSCVGVSSQFAYTMH